MHKLRLRSKSKSGKQQNSTQIHDDSAQLSPPTSATTTAQLAPLGLNLGASNDFRTSVILPDLFARLRAQDGSLISMDKMQSHLRSQRENGRLTEREEATIMQQYRIQSLYEASNTGKASSSSSPFQRNNSIRQQHQANLGTWAEERESMALASSDQGMNDMEEESLTFQSSSGEGNPDSRRPSTQSRSNSTRRLNRSHSPYTPITSPLPTRSYSQTSLTQSAPASAASTSASTPTSASASAAAFYAARDAARGNSLFGGGGLERDVVSKFIKPSHEDLHSSSGTPTPGASPSASSTPNRRRTRKQYATSNGNRSSSASEGRSPDLDSISPQSLQGRFEDLPPMPISSPLRNLNHGLGLADKKQKNRMSYDPYRPRDSDEQQRQEALGDDEVEGEEAGKLLPPAVLPLMPLTRKQLNRISRVLEDIEAELRETDDPMEPVQEDYHREGDERDMLRDEEEEDEEDYEYTYAHDDDVSEGHSGELRYQSYLTNPHHDDPSTNTYNQSEYLAPYMNGNHPQHPPYQRNMHSSSTTTSSNASSHRGRQFVYDDTEEIDPPLLRIPSIQDLNAAAHKQAQQDNEGQDVDKHVSLAESEQTNATERPTSPTFFDRQQYLRQQQQQNLNHLGPTTSIISSTGSHSPGLAYLQPSPVPSSSSNSSEFSQEAEVQPASSAPPQILQLIPQSKSVLLNQLPTSSSNGSVRLPPPVSAVQSTFPHSTSTSFSLTRHAHNGSVTMTPSASQHSISSLNSQATPPLSPPPSISLPPIPKSASTSSSLHSLRQFQAPSQQPSLALPPAPNGQTKASYSQFSSIDSTSSSLYKVPKPVAQAKVKQPNFDGYAFPSPVPEGDYEGFSPRLGQDGLTDESPRNTVFLAQEVGQQDIAEEEQEPPSRSQSRISTGSSWNGPSFSPVDADFPSGSQNLNRLSGVLEDDEVQSQHITIGQVSSEDPDPDTISNQIQGLNMADLLEIQNVLAKSAMERQASAQSLPVSVSGPSIELYRKIDTDRESPVERILPSLQGANGLGSPFMEEAEQMPSLSQLRRQPSNASSLSRSRSNSLAREKKDKSSSPTSSGRATPIHPSSRPLHARQKSASSLRHATPLSPPASTTMSPSSGSRFTEDLDHSENDYFNPRPAPSPTPEPLPTSTSGREAVQKADLSASSFPASPPAMSPAPSPSAGVILRTKGIRTSNATPSMLIRHVQHQASEATNALKNSSGGTRADFGLPPLSPEAPTGRKPLLHRKSTKNLKISTPQLVSASANLEHMPSVETIAGLRSPDQELTRADGTGKGSLSRKPSSAGLKFKMRLNKSTGHSKKESESNSSKEDGAYNQKSADASLASLSDSLSMQRGGSNVSNVSQEQHHGGRSASRAGDAQTSIRSIMSKLRRRKQSTDLHRGYIPDPMILDSPPPPASTRSPASTHSAKVSIIDYAHNAFPTSPHPSAAKVSSESRVPATYSVAVNRRCANGSFSSQGTSNFAETAPLTLSDKTSPKAGKIAREAPSTGQLTEPANGQGDRTSATSVDSMKQLFEAATALGLDADRVNELVGAAGYKNARRESTLPNEDDRIVKSTVIIPATFSMEGPAYPMTPPQTAQTKPGPERSASTSTSKSMHRTLSGKERKTPPSADTSMSMSPDPKTSGHRKSISEADTSTGSARRSVHDRPPTPPPARSHHRRKSEVEQALNPLPVSPKINDSFPQAGQPAIAQAMSPSVTASSTASDTRAAHAALAHARMSIRSMGSYDARSIYGLYGDDDEEIPPPPSLPADLGLVLASGRIPGASSDLKRASFALAPGIDMRRISTASRHSRIELAEYANGDIAFNIIQSLRADRNTVVDRQSFFPVDMHRRQASDHSFEEELAQKAKPIDSDPLRLMVRRNQAARKAAELTETGRTATGHPSLSASQRSVLEVIETDENQVAALIEELTRGLDEGQFNLTRNGSISASPQQTYTRSTSDS